MKKLMNEGNYNLRETQICQNQIIHYVDVWSLNVLKTLFSVALN